MLNSAESIKNETLISQFKQVRKASIEIALPLSDADMQIQSMTDASPTKWHLAHTSWAFETFILKSYCPDYREFNHQFEYLFNSYYNAVGEQFPRAKRGMLSRPSVEQVMDYRKHVDKNMLNLIDSELMDNESLRKLLLLTINHEQQHQELMLTDLKHALFVNPDYPVYREGHPIEYKDSSLEWIQFAKGLYNIGHHNEAFYFDNEGPQHQVYLQDFKLASRLVTCGEYLQFIKDGGYQQPSFWLSEAWSEISQNNTIAPYYWVNKGEQWFQYSLSGLKLIDLNSPVMHISYFEASAYANYVDKRLPTEQEWEVAARSSLDSHSNLVDNNLIEDCSDSRLTQMFGELWQWTSSSYNAYPGFKIHDGVVGEYNGKFMVNQYVLRGGSRITPKGHIRPSYRNFFYPSASWQFTGIRLAESI